MNVSISDFLDKKYDDINDYKPVDSEFISGLESSVLKSDEKDEYIDNITVNDDADSFKESDRSLKDKGHNINYSDDIKEDSFDKTISIYDKDLDTWSAEVISLISSLEYENDSKKHHDIESFKEHYNTFYNKEPILNKRLKLMIVTDKYYNNEDRLFLSYETKNLLANILKSINKKINDTHITPIIKKNSFNKKSNNYEEAILFLDSLKKELSLISPDIIFAIGVLAKEVFDKTLKENNFDRFISLGNKKVEVIQIPDLDFLLRVPSQKKIVWENIKPLSKEEQKEC